LTRWWFYQQFYVAIALTVYAILWAVGQPPDPRVVVLYAFCLGNLNTVAVDLLRIHLPAERFPYDWLLFTWAEFCLIPPIFVISTELGFLFLGSGHMTPPFWRYVATGWKVPALMCFLFGAAYNFHRQTRERLESRNRELQQAVASEIAGRELQEQDLGRAREIQEALLPKEIEQVPGFEVVAAWEPARLVGGDYYDVIRLSDHKLAVCIADVVGKGVSAALLMANLQATVRAYASQVAPPSWLCSRVNDVLCNNIAADKFVTLFYGILDSETRTMQYANAGHLPPVLMHVDGTTEQLNEGGAVLGVFRGWQYQDGTVYLGAGDRLFLFTDGITEASSSDGEEFGERGLLQAAKGGASLCLADLKTHLLVELNQFCNARLHDDATLMVIAASDRREYSQGRYGAPEFQNAPVASRR
jgi:sigma-B regulation protein RsbU (phosphoserine phosphatase)